MLFAPCKRALELTLLGVSRMCKSNQDKLYTAENPTIHKLLMSKQRLFHVARVDSSLSQIYKQPCIVFAGHVSLRSGAAVEFLKKWGKNAANVIIFTGT